ncbi:MAG: glycosyltransferase [Methanobacteriaceae archaeon]|nr:glycosyltransferase [Methanobacteriaceae archaeon]
MKKAIFYFSSINYNFLRQRPQQLFHNLRRVSQDNGKDYEIFYVDPPQLKLKSEGSVSTNHKDQKNVIMPIPGHISVLGRLGSLIRPLISYLINRRLNVYNFDVKIAILASPIWEPYVSEEDFDMICYDYMDSLELYGFNERHSRLVEKSDIIFTTAHQLKKEIFNMFKKDAVLVSNGVDPEFFREKSNYNIDFNKKNKVVGYVGAVYDWIDLGMIYHAARSLNDVDFVFIGPLTSINQKKAEDPNKPINVYFLGQKNYEMVPGYVNMFDVAIIPFQSGDVALSTDPIKVYEYFALGKPVVATAVKELERFNDGKVLKMADDSEEFINSLKFFLENDNITWQEARKDISEENSWMEKSREILKHIDNYLHNKKI